MVELIDSFRGEYNFLSNFYEGVHFTWRNELFPTAEHAFQYAKVYSMEEATLPQMTAYCDSILAAKKPEDAKKLGRTVKIDLEHWHSMRVQYMREIIHNKFNQIPGLAGKLINTGHAMLVEGNTWGDTYWGRCNGKGYNKLGVILMEERGFWLHSNFKDE